MPRIPIKNTPGVQQQGLPNAKFSPEAPLEAFGGGRSLDRFTQTLNETMTVGQSILLEEKKNADDSRFTELDLEASKEQTRIEIEAKKLLGKNAAEAPDYIDKEWQSVSERLKKEASNDAQRSAISKALNARYSNLNKVGQLHMAGEIQKHDVQQSEAYLLATRNEAIENYNDPDRIGLSLYQQEQEIIKIAKRTGEHEDVTKVRLAEAKSKTFVGVLNRMLANGQDLEASKYYKEIKDHVSGQDAISLEKALEEGSLRGESQRRSDAIVGSTLDRASALKKAREIDDPKLRDEVENRVNKFFSEKRQAENEIQENLYLQATNLMDAKKGVAARDVIPPDMWSKLDLNQRRALEARGEDPANDSKAWLDLLEMPPAQIAKMSRAEFETKYWSKFDSPHRTRAESMWLDAKTGKETSFSSTLTYKDWALKSARAAGIIPAKGNSSDWNEEQKLSFDRFEGELALQVSELQRTTGKKVTDEQIKQLADAAVKKKVFAEDAGWFWFDKEKTIYELTDEERGTTYVPIKDIPKSAVDSIVNLGKSRGIQVSKDQIQRAYAAALQGDDARVSQILGVK